MILVVDVKKGFETQTGECLILGEVTKKPMIIALNKIDLIEESKREETIEKVTRKIQKTLEATIFKSAKVIPVSAAMDININKLKDAMVEEVEKLKLVRDNSAPFLFAFDHCFLIKGSGTVLSGTVLQGNVKVHDIIEIPNLKTERKIKSMQMFRKSVTSGSAGDRLGLCITNFDPKLLERGLVCQKGCVQPAFALIIKLEKIRFFRREIRSKSKFHCSIGHETAMGNITLFSSRDAESFNWNHSYTYEDEFSEDQRHFFALIEFPSEVMVAEKMLIIGSKLDTEQMNVCRLAFNGTISLENSSGDRNYQQTFLPRLQVFKVKSREGIINRVVNNNEVIAANLFKKETDRSKFFGMTCELSTGESGSIASSFGQSSKVRIQFLKPLSPSILDILKNAKNEVKVNLNFKKFIFDKNHKMVQ